MSRKPTARPAAQRGVPFRLGTGWLPEPPDKRDFTTDHPGLGDGLVRLGMERLLRRPQRMPKRTDLRQWAGPVYFQGGFNTCASHVVTGLLAYFESKVHQREVAASRLFLYKVAKNFLQTTDDTGVYIRQVMGVLKLIGVPPEKYWPYPDPGTFTAPRMTDPLLEAEPSAFCYAVAADYRAVSYYRLDHEGQRVEELLRLAKVHLALQIPFAFGFPLYRSILDAKTTGLIPAPAPAEQSVANHAVVAMGYDDALEIAGAGGKTKGALLVKNSWSDGWGQQGFGWLPYDFVLRGLTRDFWTLTQAEWTDSGAFQLIV